MILEQALGLKKGMRVSADMSWKSPQGEEFSERTEYTLEGDAVAVFPGVAMGEVLFRPLAKDVKPCNAVLPVRDDRGQLSYPTHVGFEFDRPDGL